MAAELTIADLQTRLHALGLYSGAIDGAFGPLARAAFLNAFVGPTQRLADGDIADAAKRLLISPAALGAVCDVEASGAGFDPAARRPVIRFEPHKFQEFTAGQFDKAAPVLSHSYGQRDAFPQPNAQAARWGLLTDAAALAPMAALSATSFGLFQIMGFNAATAGYADAWEFARGMASGEHAQLMAFCQLLKAEHLIDELQRGDWAGFARRYNGASFADDDYESRLAKAYDARVKGMRG